MKVDGLTTQQAADVARRLERGLGEYINVPVVADDGSVTDSTYYVGKMNMGQTGQLIPVLLKVFTNLSSTDGEVDLVTLTQSLDEDTLATLLAIILEEKNKQFVIDNYDVVWAVDVLVTFFKHNDFLQVINKVTALLGATLQATAPEAPAVETLDYPTVETTPTAA